MTQSLRAADLGHGRYEWPEWLPDGATWTRDEDGKVEFWLAIPQPSWRYWCPSRCKNVPQSLIQQIGLTPPDFGDRQWEECILIKGQEPELPSCPPGDGWIEWHGGECPVPPTTDVDVQLRNGEVTISSGGDALAGDWCWEGNGYECDIVRYRVHQRKYRPYSDTEMKQRVYEEHYVCTQDGERGGMISGWRRSAASDEIFVHICGTWYGAATLLAEWQYRDGSPCGVEVSE